MDPFFQNKKLQEIQDAHNQDLEQHHGEDDLRAFHQEIGLVAPGVSAGVRARAIAERQHGGEKPTMPAIGNSKDIKAALQLSSGRRMRLNAEKTLNSASNTALKAGLKGLIALSRIQSEIEDENLDSQRRLQMTGPSKASQGESATQIIKDIIDDLKSKDSDALESKKQDATKQAVRDQADSNVRQNVSWSARLVSKFSSLAKRLFGRTSSKLETDVALDEQQKTEKESLEESYAARKSSERIKQVYKINVDDEE